MAKKKLKGYMAVLIDEDHEDTVAYVTKAHDEKSALIRILKEYSGLPKDEIELLVNEGEGSTPVEMFLVKELKHSQQALAVGLVPYQVVEISGFKVNKNLSQCFR